MWYNLLAGGNFLVLDKESGIALGIESILHQSKLKTEVQKLFRKLPG